MRQTVPPAAGTVTLPGFPPLLCGFAPSSFAFGYGVTGRVLCAKSFASMADESFKEFVLDQLSALPDARAKAMFGAHGLYSGGRFFGILDEGRLFFKTDAPGNRGGRPQREISQGTPTKAHVPQAVQVVIRF